MEEEEIFSRLYEKTSDLTKEFDGKGIPREDLDQERALMILEYLHENKHTDRSDDDVILDLGENYRKIINDILSRDEAQMKVTDKVLKRVNKVNDAAVKYKEDFFVKPTPKELADYLGVTESYILDTVQMSGYEISEIDFEPK